MIPALLVLAATALFALVYRRPVPLVIAGADHCVVLGSRQSHQAQFVDCGRYYLFPSRVGASRLVDLDEDMGTPRAGQPFLQPEVHQIEAHLGARYVFAVWW